MLRRDLLDDACQFGEVFIGELEAAKRIVDPRVESGRHEDEIGPEGLGCGQELFPKRADDLFAARASGDGAVDRQPRAGSLASFGRRPRTRIERMLVGVEEQHGAVLVEDVLSAVAMVHVPVGDEHTAHAVLRLRVPRSDRDIVEEAEAHALLRRRMMSRRPHHGKSVSQAACQHLVHGRQQAPGRQLRNFQGSCGKGRVAGGESVQALGHVLVDDPQVVGRVAPQDLLVGRGPRRDRPGSVEESVGLESLHDRGHAAGLLGMPLAGEVLDVGLGNHEAGGGGGGGRHGGKPIRFARLGSSAGSGSPARS